MQLPLTRPMIYDEKEIRGAKPPLFPYLDTLVITLMQNFAIKVLIFGLVEPFLTPPGGIRFCIPLLDIKKPTCYNDVTTQSNVAYGSFFT